MGGHGGLNILPQKRWNVYNFDNREKVRKDEEAAAREEQIKLEQSRRQDFEFRLQKLRQSRNIPDPQPPPSSSPSNPSTSNHINLFENSTDFSFLAADPDTKKKKPLKEEKVEKKRKREENVVVTAEDEKYRLGYGLAGKGVKAPWYLEKSSADFEEERGKRDGGDGEKKNKKSGGGKKSIEELREERMRRERKEKEREREILRQGKGFSR